MIKTNHIIILALLGLLSCKNEKKEQEQINENKLSQSILKKIENSSEITDFFVLTLEVLAPESDTFQLFYTEDYMLNFSENQVITKAFRGSNNYQKIVFQLPKTVFPDRLRLDVGGNIAQKELKIKLLKISYKSHRIVIPDHLFLDYFVPNSNIEYDLNSSKYYLKAVSYEGQISFDPYFSCSPKLVRLLYNCK